MLKINNCFRIALASLACFSIQACSEGHYYFLITNTKSGNLCVENFELSATDPYALKVSKILYARYGEGEGEKKMYAGSIGGRSACDKLTEYDAPRPNLIISVEFYKTVIEPEYLGVPPNTNI
jgi:hypothetical protein